MSVQKKSIIWMCAGLLFNSGASAQDGASKNDALLAAIKRDMEKNPPIRVAPAQEQFIALQQVGTADSEFWTEQTGYRTVRNVTQPALYPVLPAKGTANGTAVVIVPGGGFMSLAFDTEGMMVARHLAQRGVTCFVLKYRLNPTPTDTPGYAAVIAARVRSADPSTTVVAETSGRFLSTAQDDGLAAMRWVRQHAAQYGVQTDRIGMLGFSAGGATTMAVATAYDTATRPDFIGVMYGFSLARPVPPDAPPAFIAVAADDSLLAHASTPIYDSWRARGRSAELHIYAAGGHGFGMRKVGTGADQWINQFTQWLEVQRLMK